MKKFLAFDVLILSVGHQEQNVMNPTGNLAPLTQLSQLSALLQL